MPSLEQILVDVRACQICSADLPEGPRPVVQCSTQSRILIAGQAPGRKVHQSGVPFDDASGKRLREWLGLSDEEFYDAEKVAILPMGFCYPGTGKSGDLPPRAECIGAWRQTLLAQLSNIEITLVLGQYAQAYHFAPAKQSLTELVKGWRIFWPGLVPLPHPSPRNNLWLKKNPWFERDMLPELKTRIREILTV